MEGLPSVDELFKFSTNKGKTESVVMLPISEISNFPNNPYKIEKNEEMESLIESIKERGVKQPVIVRRDEKGNYEMVSGHRRKFASEILGIQEIPAIIRDLTKDEATILMVDSNIQREKVLPSEKAFAYKMKMEAISHQGKKETSRQVGEKLVSADLVGNESGESGRQVQRYIRLTELIKELLDMVDIGKISFNPAVEISYLKKEEQYMLINCIKMYDATPSQAQAIYLKKLSQAETLSVDKIEAVMQEEKPNQKEKYSIHYERFEKYIPRDIATPKEVEDFLFKCVEEHYNRQRQKQKSIIR